jgi:hypothetical protein
LHREARVGLGARRKGGRALVGECTRVRYGFIVALPKYRARLTVQRGDNGRIGIEYHHVLGQERSPKRCPTQEVCADGLPDYKPLFVVAAGLAQAVGTVLLVAGLTSERRYLKPKDLEVSVVSGPLGQGAYGLGVIGAF